MLVLRARLRRYAGDELTGAVDNLVQRAGSARILRNAAVKGIGRRIEEAPGARWTPIVRGDPPSVMHVGNALKVDNLLQVHPHDRASCVVFVELDRLVEGEFLRLHRSLSSQGLDDRRNKARKVALGICRVLALDDVIADEGEIVAYEDAAAERDPDREGSVVAVAKADRVGVIPVRRAQREHAEET